MPVLAAQHKGQQIVAAYYNVETMAWNLVSPTPTPWDSLGRLTLPWRKAPKSIRNLYRHAGSKPKSVTIEVQGYDSPPPNEPIFVGSRIVLRQAVLKGDEVIRRHIVRAARQLQKDRGVVTVFSKFLVDDEYQIGLTYHAEGMDFAVCGPLPPAWEPFRKRASTGTTPEAASPASE